MTATLRLANVVYKYKGEVHVHRNFIFRAICPPASEILAQKKKKTQIKIRFVISCNSVFLCP